MNRFMSITKPLKWFMALLLVAFVAGCGGDETVTGLPTVVSVAVTPATASLSAGITQQFMATATYSDGLSHDVTAAADIVWTSATTSVATVSATGVATGVASGTSVITAAIGGQSATATLTVTSATLVSIAVTPATASIPMDITQQFTATATYSDATTADVTASSSWLSSDITTATVDPASGLATGVAVGTTDITADFGGMTSTVATLTVNTATLVSIAVTPATASVAAGITQQFTATATYSDTTTHNVTANPGTVWNSTDLGVATVSAVGLAAGVAVGPADITADFGGMTSTAATLTVTSATLVSVAVTPATPSIAIGDTQQFTATATYSDGTTPDVTADPGTVWSSSDTAIATVVSDTGLATGVAVGTTDITAEFGGETSPAITLEVTAAPATVLPGIAGTSGANATNPTVNSANPSEGDINVPISTRGDLHTNLLGVKLVTATFNEAMDPTTIESSPAGTLSTFTLKETIAGTNVPGTVAMNTANTMATFTPTALNLNADTSYTVTITTAAENIGGTAMPNTVEWSFTTRAASSANQASPFVGQAPIDLLTAGNFAILAESAITEAVPANGAITGDIGLSGSSGTFITVACSEMLEGSQIHEDDAGGTDPCFVQSSTTVAQAILDKGTAYLEAANRSTPDATELGSGNISGLTIYPGLYKWATTGVDINTDVTLDGEGDTNAVWIFQISGDLAIAAAGDVPSGIKVILTNGAKASNIFWQVAAASAGATLNDYSTFNGNIMSSAQVIMGAGAVLNGRAMAATQVTLIGNTVTQPAP